MPVLFNRFTISQMVVEVMNLPIQFCPRLISGNFVMLNKGRGMYLCFEMYSYTLASVPFLIINSHIRHIVWRYFKRRKGSAIWITLTRSELGFHVLILRIEYIVMFGLG